jgi:hypothetical protein
VRIRTIRFRQSGGFAGLVRGCEVAPGSLGAAEVRALERHGQASGTAAPAGPSAARDFLIYEFELEHDAGVRRFAFDETNLPEDLAVLVERLSKSSRPLPP